MKNKYKIALFATALIIIFATFNWNELATGFTDGYHDAATTAK